MACLTPSPPTLLLGYKSPPTLAVFRVEPSLSPILTVLTFIMIVLNKIPILTSVRIIF